MNSYADTCAVARVSALAAAARIQACAEDPAALAPEAIFDAVGKIAREQEPSIRSIRVAILELMGEAIEVLVANGGERSAAIRMVAHELQAGAAFAVRAAKRMEGEDISPERFALVAFEIADEVGKRDWSDASIDEASAAVVEGGAA